MVGRKQFEKVASNAVIGEGCMRGKINEGKPTGSIVNGVLWLADVRSTFCDAKICIFACCCG